VHHKLLSRREKTKIDHSPEQLTSDKKGIFKEKNITLSNCVNDSLKSLGSIRSKNDKIATSEMLLDIVKYGKGSSVKKFRQYGIDESFIEKTAKKHNVRIEGRIDFNKDYLGVLNKLLSRLDKTKISWTLTGGFGLAIQGLANNESNIDIQTDKKGAFSIEKKFKKNINKKVQLGNTNQIKSYHGILDFNGIKVEIMGDIQLKDENGEWESPMDFKNYIEYVYFKNIRVPVLSLRYEAEGYLKMCRKERAQEILNFIDKKIQPTTR